jgi:hypothetical protein
MIKHIAQVKNAKINVIDTKTTMNLKKMNYIGLWKGVRKRNMKEHKYEIIMTVVLLIVLLFITIGYYIEAKMAKNTIETNYCPMCR